MTMTERAIQKRDNIASAALNLFQEIGYNHVTMGAIAKKANVSKVTLYKYFSDKQFLYEYLIKMIYDKERTQFEEVVLSRDSFHDKISEIINIRVNKYYDVHKRFFSDFYTRSADLNDFMTQYVQDITRLRNKLYSDGRKQGQIASNVSDETIELYLEIIQVGLSAKYHNLSDLESSKLTELLKLIYVGIIKETEQ